MKAGDAVEVVLVRHGESVWNAEHRYQGQHGPGLTESGKRQAAAAAQYVIDRFGSFDTVLAGDLPRVRETLEAWSSLTGVRAVVDERWREIDAGAWSGLRRPDVAALYPRELEAFDAGEDVPRGGGETFAQLRARAWSAMEAAVARCLENDSGCSKVLVFTHGGCIRVAAAEVLDLPPMGHRWLSPPGNCSVTVLRFLPGRDDTLHAGRLVDYNVSTSRILGHARSDDLLEV